MHTKITKEQLNRLNTAQAAGEPVPADIRELVMANYEFDGSESDRQIAEKVGIPTGQIKSFGPVGPKYEVGKPLCKLDDGDWMVEVTLIESGEKAEYRLSKIHQDPAAI